MMYNALDVADYIVSYCMGKGNPVSNLKLQKILYFLWINYYNQTKTELFQDSICAWQLGPVVPKVYYAYCQYAGLPITQVKKTCVEEQDKDTLNAIIDKFLPFSASTLVNMTHEVNKPWDTIYQGGKGAREVIPFSLIKTLECDN